MSLLVRANSPCLPRLWRPGAHPLSYMETLLIVTEAIHISEASDMHAFPFKTPWQLRTPDKLPINKVT